MPWKDVTSSFSEQRRHYKDTYLEVDEIYGEGKNTIEVSLFSSETSPYEIFIQYGIMYGVVYTDKKSGFKLREEIKEALQKEYDRTKQHAPSKEFINAFGEKYGICIPNDTFFNFDMDAMLDAFSKISRINKGDHDDALDDCFLDDMFFKKDPKK